MNTRPVLFARDIARIWTEERQRKTPGAPPVQPSTVWSYRKESGPGGRYQDDPMPAPTGTNGTIPFWDPSLERDLRVWWDGRKERRRERRSRRTTNRNPKHLESDPTSPDL